MRNKVEIELEHLTSVPDVETWVAKFKGKQIKTYSNKSSWRKINHAKNAIRNSISYSNYRGEGFRSAAEACKHYEDLGLLTYERIN